MAQKAMMLALIAAASPVVAAAIDAAPTGAPPGGPTTLYCMRVDPITGSNVKTTQCWTRAEWADQGVDLDKEWAKNGVRTEG